MQEVDWHIASLSWRYVKEDLTWERRLIEPERCNSCSRTSQTRPHQSQRALAHIDINHRWVDVVDAARSLEDADEVTHLFRSQSRVRSLASGASCTIKRAARICDRERRFAVQAENRVQLPPTYEAIQPRAGTSEESLALAEREFVDGVEVKDVSSVKVGNRIFAAWAGVVDQRFEVSLVGSRRVRQISLERVVGLERQTLREATTHFH